MMAWVDIVVWDILVAALDVGDSGMAYLLVVPLGTVVVVPLGMAVLAAPLLVLQLGEVL